MIQLLKRRRKIKSKMMKMKKKKKRKLRRSKRKLMKMKKKKDIRKGQKLRLVTMLLTILGLVRKLPSLRAILMQASVILNQKRLN